jgi:hypothetical protein
MDASVPAKKRGRAEVASSEQTGTGAEETERNDNGNRSRKRAATEGKNYRESQHNERVQGAKVQATGVCRAIKPIVSCMVASHHQDPQDACIQDHWCKTEFEAIEGTQVTGNNDGRPRRRLKLFAVVNSEDDMMRLQHVGQEGSEELFMQGAMLLAGVTDQCNHVS